MTDRRELLSAFASLGIGTLPFQRSLAAAIQAEPRIGITPEMIQQAEWVAGIKLNDSERKAVASAVQSNVRGVKAGHAISLPNHVPPAIHFSCVPEEETTSVRGEVSMAKSVVKKPETNEDLAWQPAYQLAHLLNTRQVSSVDLAKLFLDRLHSHNDKLKFVVTFTDDLAMSQAKQADEERAKGIVRGPFHGIPWGAKDLIAVKGYPTTWGAAHFKNQILPETATVAKTLENAGMVLLAKLTLGALAWGDQWFGGQTRNPWNPSRGSSGSSAGSASAVAAGCVPVAIGSETLGSIISPCRECGVTGLRPTFGRISRAGCMTLSWSMDKLGPMTRSVEDCAVMLGLLHGRDPADAASVTKPFHWPGYRSLKSLTVGYFENATTGSVKEVIETLKGMGCTLKPINLPNRIPMQAMSLILGAEAACAFDELTRDGISEGIGLWPITFREARFTTAVDYLRANRLRTLLMQEMASLMKTVDLYIGGNDLQITNLTGHPSICLPVGHTKSNDRWRPLTATMTGRLFGETELLTVARAYQEATGHHLKRPML